MKRELFIFIFGYVAFYSEGTAIITVPPAGNCGEDTVLKCDITGSISFTGWHGLGRSLFSNGRPVRPEDNNKYTETRGTSSFTLTIHKTNISDEGTYKCTNGFIGSQLSHLNIECKASAAVMTVTSGKEVFMTVDKLYPASPTLMASFNKENGLVTVQGTGTCSSSTQYSGYYKCEWTSSNSLDDGSYTYSLIVTTITQADPLTGSFKIVSPQTLTVLNTVNQESNREVVYGNEGQSLTIQCTSRGGYPAPTVAWYKNNTTSSNQKSSTSNGILQGDGTYTVTLQHTFTPTVSDDLNSFICRSYYPHADSAHRGSKTKTIILYLTLKPTQPTVTQTSVVSTGDTVEVSCNTTGCRPAANMSWSYQGTTTTGEVISTIDATTETYTVVSLFRRQVTAADNGRTVQYIVTHPALINPSERSGTVELNVRFGPSTTRITGNKEMIVSGKTALTLTCTTGSSNPASDITWKNGSVTLSSSRPYTESTGNNNGLVRSQQLILYPTRYMDGDDIICSVSNIASQSGVMDTITLNLKYRPLIKPMPEIIAVEGNTTVLTCVASSKPASLFKWYKEGQSITLNQGTGTLDMNKLSYTINNTRRTDAATYNCNANNGIETGSNENVLLTVYYPPDVTVTTTNTTVKATSTLITCNARGVPDSNYKYGKWTQTLPGNNFPILEEPGSETLVLTDLTYEHSGVYTCSASNGIKVFGTDKEFVEGSVQLLVKSFPILTYVREKIPAKLNGNATVEVHYYSNIDGSEVKIYKNRKGTRQGVIYTVSETPVEINLPVFQQIIKTSGTKARIFIQIHSTDDLGLYDVVVSNEIDSNTRSFEIFLKGPPSTPYDVRVDFIQSNTARLSCIRGYHGGYAQTFVIQLSTDLSNWRNITVYGGNDESREPLSHVLSGLHDSSTYYVRMYAFNKEGNSTFTENLNYTTPSVKEKECGPTGDSSALIVGLVLGLVIAVVVTYAIYITVLLKRKQVFIHKEGNYEQANKQMYVNLAVSPEGRANIKKKKERENNTFKDDEPSENQYTELNKQLRDQESAYEAISSM